MLDIFKIWFHEVFINEGIASLAFLILLGLSVVVVIYAFFTSNKKRAYLALLLPFIFYIYSKIHCGPCLRDMIIMQPMAEKISAYIIKHGIPERLEDIPDLPYRLEGCVRKVEYSDNEKKVNSIKEAVYGNFSMDCMIFAKTKKYSFSLLFTYIYTDSDCTGNFEIFNPSSKTVLNYSYDCKNMQIVLYEKHGKTIGSSKTDGICNPMRQ